MASVIQTIRLASESKFGFTGKMNLDSVKSNTALCYRVGKEMNLRCGRVDRALPVPACGMSSVEPGRPWTDSAELPVGIPAVQRPSVR